MKTVLITGAVGFIGFHLSKLCLEAGYTVVGIDNLSNYYDVQLKLDRESILKKYDFFSLHKEDIQSSKLFSRIVNENVKIDIIVHLAAQAGVRHSIDHPEDYVTSNLIGTFKVLELARAIKPLHTLMASTSSVYGSNKKMPFTETERTDHPLSFYAATKKSNEVMAHSYSHVFQVPITLFRFFTVYGEWGRPDMALYKFASKMLNDEPIDVYNFGEMERDFTYVGDLVKAIELLFSHPPSAGATQKPVISSDSLSPSAPHRICNIGNSQPINLMEYIKELEKNLKIESKKNYVEMQTGDVPKTFANVDLLRELTGFVPSTPIATGVKRFANWYLEYQSK